MKRWGVVLGLACCLACSQDGAAPPPSQPDAATLAGAEAGPVFQQRRRQFQSMFQAANYPQALEEAKKALAAAPVLREPYIWVSTLCRQLGRNQEAIRLFGDVAAEHPELALPWFYKGFNEYHMNLFDDALASFEHASRLDPSDAPSWYRQGMIHYVKSDFHRAAEVLEQSYRLDPSDAQTIAKWVDVLRIEGESERALEIVRAGLVAAPDAAPLLYRRGLLELNAGHDDVAEQAFRASIQQDPSQREPHEHLARLLAKAGQQQAAQRERNISERLGDYEKTRMTLEHRMVDARDGAFPLLLAEVELTAGKNEQALQWFQRAAQLGGYEPRVAAGRAEAFFRLGRIDEATRALAAAEAGTVRTRMSELARQLKLGNREHASELFFELLPALPAERQLLRRAADYALELGEMAQYDALLERAVHARTLSAAPDAR